MLTTGTEITVTMSLNSYMLMYHQYFSIDTRRLRPQYYKYKYSTCVGLRLGNV